MKKSLVFGALIAALAVPLAARSAGMDSMRYYVGTWSCQAGQPGKPQQNATSTYTLDGGVLRQWVAVPAQGKMKAPYYFSSSTTWDSKKRMYVQTSLDSEAAWSVDYAAPWSGNMEKWTDHATADGKLGHSTATRTNQGSFTFMGYAGTTGTKAVFAGTCTRS